MADNQHKAALETLLKSKGPPLGSKLDEQEVQLVLECLDILTRERLVRADLLESFTESELRGLGIPAGVAKTLKKAFPGAAGAGGAGVLAGDGAREESEMKASLLEVFSLTVVPLFHMFKFIKPANVVMKRGLKGGWLAKLFFALAWLTAVAVAAAIPVCSWLGSVWHIQKLQPIARLYPEPYYFAIAIGGVTAINTAFEFLLDKLISPSIGRGFLLLLLLISWCVVFLARFVLCLAAMVVGVIWCLGAVAFYVVAVRCGRPWQEARLISLRRLSRMWNLLLHLVCPNHHL